MALCHTSIALLENIVASQAKESTSLHEMKQLWQEFYFFLEQNRREISHQLWGTDGMRYFELLNKALLCPIYLDGKELRIQLSEENIDVADKKLYSIEEREILIAKAIAFAIKELKEEYHISEKTSFYNCCGFASKKIARFLQSNGIRAHVMYIRDIFPSQIPHAFCLAIFRGEGNIDCAYLIDITYRQFYTLGLCLPESRNIIYERDTLHRTNKKNYIGPAYFASKMNQEKLEKLFQKGYFSDLASLELYGNSFYQAELSRTNEDISTLLQGQKSGKEYFDTLKKKLGGKK